MTDLRSHNLINQLVSRIYKLVDDLEPGTLRQNNLHRFPAEQIDKIFPQIRVSIEDHAAQMKRTYFVFYETSFYVETNANWS